MNIRTLGALGASLYLGMSGIAHAATAERAPAGTLRDGTAAEVIELKGKNGVSARILTYGATLQSLIAPDSKGKKADVVLGHDTVQEYEAKQDFFGVTVGRFANRIAKGRFTLDGNTYQLPLNNGANTLHGGGNGLAHAVVPAQGVAPADQQVASHWRQRSLSTAPAGSSSCTCNGIWPAAWVEHDRQGSKQRMPASTRLSRPSLISAAPGGIHWRAIWVTVRFIRLFSRFV